MQLLKDSFDELLQRVRRGRDLGSASFEPVYYLIFPPSQILEVKRQTAAWTARLKNEGWDPHLFSMSEHIVDLLENTPLRKIWLAADARAPLDWDRTNQALSNALSNGRLQARLEEALSRLEGVEDGIMLVTDLEALHTVMRIGTIERQLQGKFSVPTVFLYPGLRTGKTRLKFLGFYPEDGNYRSVHVGG
ncbi:MAG: DUF1788 domain-containing protein [Desulfobacterales bacterium]|nr:DUF1788 domain-containing protein [Desulfobacterales bacterium]